MNAKCFIDVETTGFSATKHDVIQVGCIIEVGGEVKETLNLKCKSFTPETANKHALDAHGYSLEEISEFPDAREQCIELFDKLTLHDYFYEFIAYNARFDLRFITEWAFKCDLPSLLSKFSSVHCVLQAAKQAKLGLDDNKLVTLCSHYGIALNAHDAESDIKATRELYKILGAVEL